MAIRKELFEKCEFDSILGFENSKEIWFQGIDSRTKFCIYSVQKGGYTSTFKIAFNLRSPEQLKIAITESALRLPTAIVREFSPNALAVMEFASQRDIDIAEKMYARWPKFGDRSAGSPYRHYMAEVHMGNNRDLFAEDSDGFPVYEGRMVAQYDHRAKGYRSGRGRAAVWEDLPFNDPAKSIQPQWYIPEDHIPDKARERVLQYRIGFCDVASPTNERTLIAALIPPRCICGDKVPTITFKPGYDWAYMVWLAIANSFAMDFLARKKVSLKMSYTVLDSLPFPRLAAKDPLVAKLVRLALQLTCTAPEMTAYWNMMAERGWVNAIPTGTVPELMDDTARLEARAELEATVAREIFGLTRQEVDSIMETFPIVKRKDSQKYGDYRTKLAILDIYDSDVAGDEQQRTVSNSPRPPALPRA